MRIITTPDDSLAARTQELTGIKERSVPSREGLETLIHAESAHRLAALGGTEPEAQISSRTWNLGDLVK